MRAQVQIDLKDLTAHHVNVRIWEHDGTVWKDHPEMVAKIKHRLGWLDVTKTIDLERLIALQNRAWDFPLDHVVLLGMGGSSLAPEVLAKTFGSAAGRPKLLMLDSTDPLKIKAVEDAIDLDKTLFIVSSKSGGTTETWSFYQYFYGKTGGNSQQFIAITDCGQRPGKRSAGKRLRRPVPQPRDIGGRYSALSYFGLVPAALIGVDLKRSGRAPSA